MKEFFKYINQYFVNKKLEKRRKSPKPFVEIISEEVNADGSINLKLDWNDSFIKLLRDNGFYGIDDEEVIDHYLYSLFKEKEYSYELSDTKK